MNKVFYVLGVLVVVLLLGSFFVEGATRDVMRLAGFALLAVFLVVKYVRSTKDKNAR